MNRRVENKNVCIDIYIDIYGRCELSRRKSPMERKKALEENNGSKKRVT